MTDLVERLRRRRDQEAVSCNNLPVVGYTGDGRLLGDAADALEQKDSDIERLRAGNELLKIRAHNAETTICEQYAEIERLRAALQRIVDESESDNGLTAWDAGDIAREALGQKEAADG